MSAMKLTYPIRILAALSVSLLLAALGFGCVALFTVYLLEFRPYAIIGSRIGFFLFALGLMGCAVAGIAILTSFLERHRTILINSDGISSLKFIGGIKKRIPWPKVVKVDIVWTLDPIARKNRHFFQICGAKDIIHFDDAILNLRAGLAEIDGYISAFRIPVNSVDRSAEVLLEIKRTVPDPNERGRLLREGRITRAPNLSTVSTP